ncbi:MAG: asparagine synthase (glutamine-hydrolyzing) [Planctomyces sp.]
MCGISGHLFPANPKRHADQVQAMLRQIAYRGPDHLGMMTCPDGSMGNVRLAIQGLDPTGNQPVWNEDKTVCVVFNGEIYNYPELRQALLQKGHKFQSQTDTEVLVHLYEDHGTDFVKLLNGMFAFAVYDSRRRILVLARDRTGQKPLFLRSESGSVCFCSELAPLITQFGTSGIDPAAVNEFLSLGYVLEPRTVCRDFRTLVPGTVEVFSADGDHSVSTWWQLPLDLPQISNSEDWLELAEPIFRRALRRHILADVPVTLFLSGGVDSSLIMLLASQETDIRETYCGSFTDAADHDEYQYAATLSTACGLSCRRVELSQQFLAESVPSLLKSMSQPLGDYSALAVSPLAAAVSRDYRVVLGGDGGDELFGGYPTYRLPHLQYKFRWLRAWMLRLGHRLLTGVLDKGSYMNLAFQLQQVSQAWGLDTAAAHFQIKNFFPQAAQNILQPHLRLVGQTAATRFAEILDRQTGSDVSQALANLDIQTFMQSGTIPKVERMTMLHSLEARLPFLDNEVLQLSQQTPWTLRSQNGQLKSPLRMLQQRIWQRSDLPKMPKLNPRKQGFSPPLKRLLDGPLAPWRRELLSRPSTVFSGDTEAVINSLRQQGFDTHRLEWHTCVLKSWLSAFLPGC